MGIEWDFAPSRLLQPSSLLLAASNLLPLAGVIVWGWDIFLIVLLFWFETAAIALWTVLGIPLMPRHEAAPFAGKAKDMGLSPSFGGALFVAAHSGIFLAVHFVFLWAIFAGPWSGHVHDAGTFLRVIIVDTGLWIPMLGLTAAHGLGFLRRFAHAPLAGLWRRLWGVDLSPPAAGGCGLGLLYGRIIATQFAIIIGAMATILFGSIVPLALILMAKTAIDLGLRITPDPA